MKDPVRIIITGGAGQIAYSLLPPLCSGTVLGPDQPVILHLLDIPPAEGALGGVVMELEDLAYPLLAGVVATTDPATAFKDVDYAIFLGSFPRKEGMERKDVMGKNVGIFNSQGKALSDNAKPTVKCIVVGNPANTNALILSRAAPNIPTKNISALTRLDHNRARAQLAAKAGVSVDAVEGAIIWGNHSSTQYPDVRHATISGTPALDTIGDKAWLEGAFVETVQKRGAAVIAARKLSSAASAAKAICDHLRDWALGTDGKMVSMAVKPECKSYDIDPSIFYSYPCKCEKGEWTIVEGLVCDDFSTAKMKATEAELQGELAMAEELLATPN